MLDLEVYSAHRVRHQRVAVAEVPAVSNLREKGTGQGIGFSLLDELAEGRNDGRWPPLHHSGLSGPSVCPQRFSHDNSPALQGSRRSHKKEGVASGIVAFSE